MKTSLKLSLGIIGLVVILALGFFILQSLNKTATKNENANTPTRQTTPTKNETQVDQAKIFTLEQVAEHNKRTDCYLIINDRVYDVTKYLPIHPGKPEEIVPYCGKEGTEAFATKGNRAKSHSDSAVSTLEKYFIGNLQTATN